MSFLPSDNKYCYKVKAKCEYQPWEQAFIQYTDGMFSYVWVLAGSLKVDKIYSWGKVITLFTIIKWHRCKKCQYFGPGETVEAE